MYFITTYQTEEGVNFYVKNTKDENIFISITHNTSSQCMNAIDSFKINAAMDKRYIRGQREGKSFFKLKAGNGKIIGNSKLFSDNNLMEQEITLLQKGQKVIK